MTALRFAALLLFSFPAALHAAEPFARSEVLTKGRLVAGQQIEIAIDVYVPNFFKGAPEFPLFTIKDAIVSLPDQRSSNMVESVGDDEFSGIRKSYMVMAEQPGDLRLPSITIPVAYANDDGATTEGIVTPPAVEFAVGAVPGDWEGQIPLVSSEVAIDQQLDRDPSTMKTGDALVRLITIRADDTQPMMIPVPEFAQPPGIKIYRADPELRTAGSDDDAPNAAQRIESVTYVAEKAGEIILPPVDVRWFDPTSGKIEVTEAPAIKIVATENPASAQVIAAGTAPAADREANRREVNRMLLSTALRGLLALLLFVPAYYLIERLRLRWEKAGRRRAESESAYFHKVETALSGKEPLLAWRALDAWAVRLGFRSISDWAARFPDGELHAALARFEETLFRGGEHMQYAQAMAQLARHLPAARYAANLNVRHAGKTGGVLPPLNP
ncbi:hypothetical protein [Rhizobium sp. LjRoot254]|uniref:hypothetical protein n=1 Tax=Rhizobium sp. LjRoot254 TaxID=3342297 RepID=UPI003ED12716